MSKLTTRSPPITRSLLMYDLRVARFLNSDNTHVVDNTGDAANGELDDITNSCFTAESNRSPVC